MIIIRTKAGGANEKYVLHFPAGLVLTFRHGLLQNRRIYAAQLPDEHAQASQVRARIMSRIDEKFSVYQGKDEDVSWGMPDAASLSKTLADPGFNPAAVGALKNGWKVEDIVGTGEGNDPSVHGGISLRTGLCLAQMAFCSPPPEWQAKADKFYPWELEGWRPPTLDFRPGNPPSKRDKSDAPVPVVVDTEPATEPEPVVAKKAPNQTPPKPKAQKPVIVENDMAKVTNAMELLRHLNDKDGALPSYQKINYHLKKHGIKTVGKAEFTALKAAI